MPSPEPEPARGPVQPGERSLAPDLARGAALLGIALANGPVHLWGQADGPGGRPVDGSGGDRLADFAVSLLADNRSYPLFALLFGYGTWQLAARQDRHGTEDGQVRRLLARRNVVLVALGFLHALLLFAGDILGTYGLLGLVLVLLLRTPDRTLLALVAASVVPLAALSAFDGVVTPPGDDLTSQSGLVTAAAWLPAVGDRMVVWLTGLVATPLLGIGLLAPMLVGVVLARRRVLEDPGAHLPLLRWVAVGGTAVSLVGGLPFALAVGGVLEPRELPALAVLHGVTGAAGGVGYVALVALAARRWAGRRPGPVIGALAATGQRSLSAYLGQSLLLTPLLAPWALGLGDDLGTAPLAALGLAVWLGTVAGCAALARAGRRGPAEVLLRRLTYPRPHPTERQGRARMSAT